VRQGCVGIDTVERDGVEAIKETGSIAAAGVSMSGCRHDRRPDILPAVMHSRASISATETHARLAFVAKSQGLAAVTLAVDWATVDGAALNSQCRKIVRDDLRLANPALIRLQPHTCAVPDTQSNMDGV
jgi:hypothetical protein